LPGGSFRRVLRTQALRRGGCRARHLSDRPPAVPAVSRCRARHTTARASPSRRVRQSPWRCHILPAAHCPGWPLRPQRCFASRCAGRAFGAPLTLET